jgi:DNA-binding CsgD family transcriptional regulator
MKHLHIILLILNLVVGFGIILFVFRNYKKYHQRLLLNLFYYCLSFNLLVFVDLNYTYTLINIFDNQFFDIPNLVSMVLFWLVFFAEFGIVYFLYTVITSLKRKKISTRVKHLLIAWFSTFSLLSIIGITDYLRTSNENLLYLVHEVWIFSMIIIIIFNLINLLVYSKRNDELEQKLEIQAFGAIFLIAYTGFTISHLDFYILHLGIVEFDTLILLIINLCPAVWLHYYYLKYQAKITGKGESFVFWRNFIEEYGLTDREEQIIELIMDGKSNQEIEDTLYISVHTVKNHIYNIYQKTGVNSRTQLLHLIKQLVSREN